MTEDEDYLPFEEDSFDICYECSGLEDDYIITEDGDLELYCPDFPLYQGGKDDS